MQFLLFDVFYLNKHFLEKFKNNFLLLDIKTIYKKRKMCQEYNYPKTIVRPFHSIILCSENFLIASEKTFFSIFAPSFFIS